MQYFLMSIPTSANTLYIVFQVLVYNISPNLGQNYTLQQQWKMATSISILGQSDRCYAVCCTFFFLSFILSHNPVRQVLLSISAFRSLGDCLKKWGKRSSPELESKPSHPQLLIPSLQMSLPSISISVWLKHLLWPQIYSLNSESWMQLFVNRTYKEVSKLGKFIRVELELMGCVLSKREERSASSRPSM